METLFTLFCAGVVLGLSLGIYRYTQKAGEARARAAAEKGQLFSQGPKAQHPHIDASRCIGCGSCASVCPEGDVLAMIGGKAAIVNGYKCVGHSLCAEACPVGAITMVRAPASVEDDLPALSEEYETNIDNLFIVGELGGLALIRNAVNQGRECIDIIAHRIEGQRQRDHEADIHDVVIVGAGPAGISASLRAIENRLRFLTIERDQLGGTVAKYPRQKLVMTSPVEFPLYGKLRKTTMSKEDLLSFWSRLSDRADFCLHSGESVEKIDRQSDGALAVSTGRGIYRARHVVLAVGRSGTPRKLGIPGEELPKVMYRLIEADHYRQKRVLVIGGGDSAVEAALGLASQPGNRVTLSYRQERFHRIKDRNVRRLEEFMHAGKIELVLCSTPLAIFEDSVTLRLHDRTISVANDFVWIFAGGATPREFLKSIGIATTSDVAAQSHDDGTVRQRL
jgi:thioredoxin reductase (NADPH)